MATEILLRRSHILALMSLTMDLGMEVDFRFLDQDNYGNVTVDAVSEELERSLRYKLFAGGGRQLIETISTQVDDGRSSLQGKE